jgi:DNA-binding NarL/FixJ family response regulator
VVRAPPQDTGGRPCPRDRALPRSAVVRGDEAVNVLTVDDQEVFRDVVRDVIEATSGFVSVGEAASGAEALRMAAERAPRLVLVDVRMPGMDGIETAQRLRAVDPGVVVVLISLEDPEFLPPTGGCGAVALVRKQDLRPALLRELWEAYGGEG